MARRLGQRPQRPQERKRHKQHVGYNVISSNGGLEVHINACGVWAVEVIFGAWEAISITMEYTGSLSHLNAAYYRCNISLMPASQGNLPKSVIIRLDTAHQQIYKYLNQCLRVKLYVFPETSPYEKRKKMP